MFKKIIFLQGIGDLNNVFLLKTGELRDTNQNSSEIESESLTTTMSNLNRLKRFISDRLFKALYIQMGYRKLSLISFPNNYEDSQLEL